MRVLWILLVSWLLSVPTQAQEAVDFERFPLRVSAALDGAKVEVDRGAGIRLKVGDRIKFETRDGRSFEARVLQVFDRKAVVEALDPAVRLALGTRGDAFVPKQRLTGAPTGPKAGATGTAESPRTPDKNLSDKEHEPWERLDEEWSHEDPLLARVRPVRPELRESRQGGRAYGILQPRISTEEGRSEVYLRSGMDYWMENPFGRGGELNVDLEWSRYRYDLPFVDDQADNNLRLDRAAYSWGGTRYESTRYEVGRFLVYGMPELGLVDGFAAMHRLPNGHSFGASIGGMPEPNPDQDSGHDLQVSTFYRWIADPKERMTAAVAFQKTWHDGSQDRDVLIGKFDWWTDKGWRVHSHTWIDLYTEDDLNKSAGPEFTQIYLSANKDWEQQRGLQALYSFRQFPSLLRDEYRQPDPTTVLRDHNQRLSLGGWERLDSTHRLRGHIGLWSDDDDSGGDLEIGMDFEDVFQASSRLNVTAFRSNGESSNLTGMRLGYGQYQATRHWDVFYEFGHNEALGFPSNADTSYQHVLRGTYGFEWGRDWNVSLTAEDVILEDDATFFIGFQIDRSF